MNTFQLKINKDKNSKLIYQILSKENHNILKSNTVNQPNGNKNIRRVQIRKLAHTYGWRLTIIEPYIKEILNNNKGKNGNDKKIQMNLKWERAHRNNSNKITIDEEDGVRLALIFKTASRIRKMGKIDKILLNLKSMSREETYYWYSKVFNNGRKQNGVRALRILINS